MQIILGHVNGNLLCLLQVPDRQVIPAPDNNLQPPANGPNNNNESNDNGDRLVAKLSRLPRTLHDLWYKWEFGFAGKKAARLFTAKERGKVTHTFYKRKFFWHKCAEMVRSGMTAQRACDKIEEVYGQGQSLTYVLEQLKRDKLDRGAHPQLHTVNL